MPEISNEELINRAEAALNSQKLDGFYVADVGCALVSQDDEVFTGACVGGYLGICAEQAAVGALVSVSSPKIKKIVAVWKNEEGALHVIPPCGRCREFLRMIDQENLDADVILGHNHAEKLRDLLPYHGWHAELAR